MVITLALLIVAVVLLVIILIISAVILSNQNQPIVETNRTNSIFTPDFHYRRSSMSSQSAKISDGKEPEFYITCKPGQLLLNGKQCPTNGKEAVGCPQGFIPVQGGCIPNSYRENTLAANRWTPAECQLGTVPAPDGRCILA
jgi:hypothetical protein